MLDKRHKALLKFAASERASRPVLEGIHITKDYAEAADGYALLRIERSKRHSYEDFPPVGQGEEFDGEAILPAEAVGEAIKGIPRRSVLPSILNVLVSKDGDNVVLTTTDLETTTNTPTKLIQGTYPKVDQLIPPKHDKDDNTVILGLGVRILEQLVYACKQLGADFVRLQISTEGTPCVTGAIRVDFTGNDDAVGVVMPSRIR